MAVTDFKKVSTLVVVSGIPAGGSGTGRFVAHLQERMNALVGRRIKLIARPERPASWQIALWWRQRAYRQVAVEVVRYVWLLSRFFLGVSLVWLKRDQRLILLHPQNLGYRLALGLLASRTRPPLLYLLDSSFFCIASYNHLKGENESCLRCLELDFNEVTRNGCKPFPRLDWAALEFTPSLQRLVKSGRVNIAAQNERQAKLAQMHFELPSLPRVIGLWTQDWDAIFAERSWRLDVQPITYAWDVLFHGHCLDAKGAGWLAAVATRCPELRFMFPFPRPAWFSAGENCIFVPCSWESGLREEIGKARLVIVPSLWSAPIEGALVKSIVCAAAVAVVDNPTSFCDELPEDVVLKLPADQVDGADCLRRACREAWRPDVVARARWIEKFAKMEEGFVPDLLNAALME